MKQKLHTFTQNPTILYNPHTYTCTRKTREKRTTDFVFHFSRVLSGQKCKYRLGKKCARDFTSSINRYSFRIYSFMLVSFSNFVAK